MPVYTDFTCAWAAELQALHGNIAALYDPAEFAKVQAALVGPRDYFYPKWPYPPTFFLILAPFTVFPYPCAFLAWDILTLLSLSVVVYFIVRRPPAVALVLASPFTIWNFLAGQNDARVGIPRRRRSERRLRARRVKVRSEDTFQKPGSTGFRRATSLEW
jgi:hypothetical protein